MSTRLDDEQREDDADRFAATGPHCGVCRHVTFLGDWERTPYCARWEEPTDISVGEVCTAFAPAVPYDRE
ncbi:MAG: hypothetical protein ABEJ40_02670 [Haloarculaceae archaeon]